MPWIDDALRVLGLNWLNGLIAIASFFFAFLSYVWTRRRTKLAYVYVGEHLLGSASDTLPPAIVVQYNGISIPRLTKTVVVIWNDGENPITADNLVASDPLRLEIGGEGEILSVAILKKTREVTNFRLADSAPQLSKQASLTFDFLDAKDGAVVEILHTSTERKPRLLGTLIGLPKGFTNLGQFTRPKAKRKSKNKVVAKLSAWVFSPLFVAFIGFLMAIYGPRPAFLFDLPESSLSAMVGVVCGFLITWAFHSWTSRRRYPKNLDLEALE
ncbi:hypothetical protein [Pseudomonas bohemica]|uniref:hypothetical protein n=1 Tax=Pseudomonas bohemica TaxID=2044872 RepID=UPI000DA63AF7|nr:hypothetical protein [Pseudomonas bohemica]